MKIYSVTSCLTLTGYSLSRVQCYVCVALRFIGRLYRVDLI